MNANLIVDMQKFHIAVTENQYLAISSDFKTLSVVVLLNRKTLIFIYNEQENEIGVWYQCFGTGYMK
jgi:hypothetical protein